MTPVSSAKLIIRLGIAAIIFAELPQIELLPVSIGITLQQPGQTAYQHFLFYAFIASIAIQALVMAVAWLGADQLARFVVPDDANAEPSGDYGQWQHAGLMLIGGCVVLRAIATSYAPCWFCGPEPRSFVNLLLGFTLMLGWETIAGAFRRILSFVSPRRSRT